MYDSVYEGMYYPTISLYMGARAQVNFGPVFAHAPSDVSYQPYSDAIHHTLAQFTMAELLNKALL